MSETSRWGIRVGQGIVAGALFGLGMLWGNGTLTVVPTARAEVIEGEKPQPFLAGSERSEIVLLDIKDILANDIVLPLKDINERLAHIEALALGGADEAPPSRKTGNGGKR